MMCILDGIKWYFWYLLEQKLTSDGDIWVDFWSQVGKGIISEEDPTVTKYRGAHLYNPTEVVGSPQFLYLFILFIY